MKMKPWSTTVDSHKSIEIETDRDRAKSKPIHHGDKQQSTKTGGADKTGGAGYESIASHGL